MRAIALLLVAVVLAGCATGHKEYALQLEAYVAEREQDAEVQKARAQAEKARFDAIAAIAKSGSDLTKSQAMWVLDPRNSAPLLAQQQPARTGPPGPPESDADRAYKWAALFAGPITNIASGYFGFKLGQTQSNNATAASIANTNAFASTAAAGFGSNASIAGAGFGAASTIAGQLAAQIQAPQPNITLSGQGVIGSGSYAVTTTTTRTCNGGAGAPGGGAGTTGNAGAGGAGGAANC